MQDVCGKMGMAVSCLHSWIRRYQKFGEARLKMAEGGKRAPKLSAPITEMLLSWRNVTRFPCNIEPFHVRLSKIAKPYPTVTGLRTVNIGGAKRFIFWEREANYVAQVQRARFEANSGGSGAVVE